jgi:hypothetical protein
MLLKERELSSRSSPPTVKEPLNAVGVAEVPLTLAGGKTMTVESPVNCNNYQRRKNNASNRVEGKINQKREKTKEVEK